LPTAFTASGHNLKTTLGFPGYPLGADFFKQSVPLNDWKREIEYEAEIGVLQEPRLAAGQRVFLSVCGINRAASARSTKSTLMVWAPSCLAAVQKETEFRGNVNVSSRT